MNHTTDWANTPRPGAPYQHTVEEAVAAIGTDVRRHLTEREARVRLQHHGRNELTRARQVNCREILPREGMVEISEFLAGSALTHEDKHYIQ
jgi:hypothetical protein